MSTIKQAAPPKGGSAPTIVGAQPSNSVGSTIVEHTESAIAKKFAVAAQITELLLQHSNKERRDILALVSSQLGLRVVPSGAIAPMVNASARPADEPSRKGKVNGGKVKKQTPVAAPAAYKKDPKWVQLSQMREGVLLALKEGSTETDDGQPLADYLHEVESAMKRVRDSKKVATPSKAGSKKDVSSQ